MGSFQQQLLERVTPPILNVLGGASHGKLINSINNTMMIFNRELIHIESGLVRRLEGLEAESIASAAKFLIPESIEEQSVLLLLPPSEFIASVHSFPDTLKENLISALYLQTESILPSYEKPLSLAIDAKSSDGNSESVALWLPQKKLENMFVAFSEQDLFLTAIKPRILSSDYQSGAMGLLDNDETDLTFVVLEDGLLRAWQQVNKLDFEQKDFVSQWESSLKSNGTFQIKELNNIRDYLPSINNKINIEYNFFPGGALDELKKVARGRKVLAGLAALAFLMIISSIPFILQSIEFQDVAKTLESSRLMSADARQDQQIVVDFENEWGPINDFPQQSIRGAMFTLQNVLSPERLSSLEISQGLIKIQGTSSDPQAILQRLEQDSLFTEVIFSRATSNTRYYIDLRLSPVNFEAYMVRYFPDN
tara:strand:+ start:810 stop:2078 length:1269 start_codon:yes stop_codon:yes gene_type:complete